MVDLPKIKTELTGDISDLAKAFAEASALRNAWLRDQESSMETGGAAAGKKGADALLKEFQSEVKGRKGIDYSATDIVDEKFQSGLQDLFSKMGRASATKFTGEFDSLLRGSGMAQRIVGDFLPNNGGTEIERVADTWVSRLKDRLKSGASTLGDSIWGGWMQAAKDPRLDQAAQNLGNLFNVNFRNGFLEGIFNLFTTPAGAVVFGGVAVAVATSVAAMLGGLFSSASILGGIAAAIYGGIQNPRVHDAMVQMGTDLKTTLGNVMSGADNPLIMAFSRIDNFFNTRAISDAFAPIFAEIVPLEKGIEAMFSAMGPKIAEALQKAAPVFDMFLQMLPSLGQAIGDFFIKVTTEVQANREGVRAFMMLLSATIELLGNIIEQLSKMFDWGIHAFDIWANAFDLIVGNVLRFLSLIPPFGGIFGWVAEQIGVVKTKSDELAQGTGSGGIGHIATAFDAVHSAVLHTNMAVEQQVALIDNLTAAWDKWFGVSMSVDNANVTLHSNMLALTDAIAQNGRTWDLNTKGGVANYQALLLAIQAAHDYRQAQIDSGTAMVQANKEYQDNVTWILTQASNAGMDASQIQELKNQVDGLINSLNTMNTIPKATPGGFSMIPFMSAEGSFVPSYAGGGFAPFMGGAANGFLSARNPGTLIMAGESRTGGEWIIPRMGISQSRAAALVGSAAANWGLGGGGGGGVGVSVSVPVYLNGKQIAQASYEDFVDFGQERKNRRGSTGF